MIFITNLRNDNCIIFQEKHTKIQSICQLRFSQRVMYLMKIELKKFIPEFKFCCYRIAGLRYCTFPTDSIPNILDLVPPS